MPYRVVEYTQAPQRHPARRHAGRSPHATVYYGGRSGYGHLIPRVAHSRIVSVPPPSRFVRGQDIYSLGEEAYRLPYRTKVVHIEDLSNYGDHHRYDHDHDHESCYDLQLYDPEIRRDASDVLMRLAYGMPVPHHYGHGVNGVLLRSPSELRDIVDVRRKFVRERNNLSSMSRIQSEIYRMAMYQEPLRKPLAGKGNLACLSFAGGRPISKRQLRYVPEDTSIRDVINFRSFYNNLRVAATLGTFYKKPVTYQPLYKSKKSLLGLKDDSEEKPKKEVESKWVTRSSEVEVDYKPRAEKVVRKPEVQQSYVLPSPRKSVVEVPEAVKSLVEPEPEVVVKISRKSIQEESPIFPAETQETIRISPHQRVEEVKEPSPEPEVEEVFQDAVESKPATAEPVAVVEETVDQPEEPISIEQEIEQQIEDVLKADEPEPEIEAVTQPETTEPEPEPEAEVFEEAVAEVEPEVAASPAPRVESRQEEIASPTTDGEQHPADDEVVVNGQAAELHSADEHVDVESVSSPPPPAKVLSDEEAEEQAQNNNYGADEEHEPAHDTAVNGIGEDNEEVKEESALDDNWWSANDDDAPRTKYRRHEEDSEHEDREDDMIINDIEEPITEQEHEQDLAKEELESECEESE